MSSDAKRVLILCTGNSCRSQLAEAIWRHVSGGRHTVWSAGTAPKGVHPFTLRVLEEANIPTVGLRSKHVDEFVGEPFDWVITVCGKADQACPTFPGSAVRMHWPFIDPAEATGPEAEVLAVFRRVRDEIRERVQRFLSESA